ncbi:Mycothiol acetyltransferase [bioreactor metagenome]|uniref:Mycothiol acetyltransferase n=1 Tax=bioreactor metagenome TaxID=1076179 RepID=A0A644WAM9_9ZZZZ
MEIGEADEISRIYAASWKYAYRGMVPQAYLYELSELRWSPFLAENPSNSFVLLERGEYIGTSSISPARDEKMAGWGEIISLYLLPEYFGKGYGKVLFQNSVQELNRRGFARIYLWTLEDNQRAIRFYEKLGFTNDGGTISCKIGGKALTEVRYILIGD